MTTQSEPLRLAELLERRGYATLTTGTRLVDGEIAAELRRLYALNQELLVALHWIADRCPVHLSDHPLHGIHREMAHDAGACARAAIARAEGRA